MLSSKWDVFIIPPPHQSSGIFVEEGMERLQESKVMYNFKETAFYRHNRVYALIRAMQAKAEQNASTEEGK